MLEYSDYTSSLSLEATIQLGRYTGFRSSGFDSGHQRTGFRPQESTESGPRREAQGTRKGAPQVMRPRPDPIVNRSAVMARIVAVLAAVVFFSPEAVLSGEIAPPINRQLMS